MSRSKSRIPLFLGLTVAGAGGYYLYAAGGDPKVAQKKVERKSQHLKLFESQRGTMLY